jgi:Zn-dependent M28 family amino/carboxypeptidase
MSKNEKIPFVKKSKPKSNDEITLLPTLEERKRSRCYCAVMLIIFVAFMIALIIALALITGLAVVNTENIAERIQGEEIFQLLNDLQDIGNNHGNSRSVLNGYNASAEYVFNKLSDNGYEPQRQYFTVPVFENLHPGEAVFKVTYGNDIDGQISFIEKSDFNVMIYSGSCDSCDGNLQIIEEADINYGCDDNWDIPEINGSIVLMAFNSSKGGCSLYQKAKNAHEAGAIAVIFGRDPGDQNVPPGSRVYEMNSESGQISTVDIPLIGVTGSVRQTLTSMNSPVIISIETYTTVTQATTYNVLARSKGKSSSTIVVGSHLDSVPAGPGINDNGSGSMANLQLAIEIARWGTEPINQILFAWWGAEELGLFGSYYFVSQLNETQDDIALNINLDMIASPNYIRGIYNGTSTNETIVTASTTIQNLLIKYFNENDLAHDIVPFSGGSDYKPFLDVNIPAGGLFTGAGGLKTQEQFDKYGGLQNAPFDPCYHLACDKADNVNQDVFVEMTRSFASAVQVRSTCKISF